MSELAAFTLTLSELQGGIKPLFTVSWESCGIQDVLFMTDTKEAAELVVTAVNSWSDPIALRNRLAELEGGCE